MRALIYKQERDNQVRQCALRLKFNYFPSLDDDLWDWQRASPTFRSSFIRGVISRREYRESPEPKKPKKLAKTDRRPSRSSIPKSVELQIKQAKRTTRRSNTTGETTIMRVKTVKGHDKRESEKSSDTSQDTVKEGDEYNLCGQSKSESEVRSLEEDVK